MDNDPSDPVMIQYILCGCIDQLVFCGVAIMKKKLRRTLAIILALFLTGRAFADYYVSAQADESNGEIDGQNGFHVSAFEVLVDGQSLEECDSVYAGAEVTVHFQWRLDNDVTAPTPFAPQTYEIDTNSPEFKNSGIDFSQMTAGTAENHSPLVQNDTVVGDYYIQDGIIYITITDERIYNNEYNRYGGVFFYGKIAKDGDKTHDGTNKDIEFGTVSSNVTYYDSPYPSSAGVWKNPSGSIFYENGKYYQTFQATVWASNGKVTDITLNDIVSEGKLTYAESKGCKITESSVEGLVKDGTYNTLGELFTAIKGATFYNNDSVTFEYTMEVDPDIFDPDQTSYSNTIEGKYKSNRDETETSTDPATAYVQVTKPSISKSASGYDNDKVEWTITVNVGDLYEEGKNSLSDYFESVTDIPGQGLQNQDRAPLPLSEFKQSSDNPREFTYTYETEVSETVKDSVADQTVKNSAEMTRNGKTYPSNEAQYTIEKNGVELAKSISEINEQDGIITWEITISGLTNGVKTLYLEDRLRANNAGHNLLDWLEVDGTVVREDGTFKNNASTVIDVEHTTDFNNFIYNDQYFYLTFTDEYVEKRIAENGGVIKLRVKSKIDPSKEVEGELHEYLNNVQGSYQSADSTQNLPSVEASYTDASDILSKTGTTSGQEVEYEIRVPMQYLDIQEGGEGFVISDILDERMQYVEDSVSVTLGNEYFSGYVSLEPSEYEYSLSTADNKITFRIPVSAKIVDGLKDNYILAIHYKAKYKDLADLVTGVDDGKNIENNAEGTYDGEEIGDSKALNDLAAPQSIISKTADYDKTTAPYVQYTVDINPDALTLLENGAKLKAEDTLVEDGALIFVDVDGPRFAGLDASSKERYRVKVYEWATVSYDNNEWQDWVELETPSDYTYTFENDRKLTFELPDSKHLKIEYYGYTVAEVGSFMNSDNSTNTFKLSAFSSDATQGGYFFDNREVENYGYVASDPGSITLFKYWWDGHEQLALTGSVFKIVSVEYDAETQKWVEGDVLKENICIPESERESSDGKIQINGLPLKRWMALYEIEADTGYVINKEPYYFYIFDSSADTPPTDRPGSEAKVFEEVTDNEVEYRNYKAAALQLEKTIIGNVTQEEAEGALQFKVTDPDGVSTVYELSEFDYDISSGKWILSLEGLVPGEYTVEETVYDIDGHEVISVIYSIDNSGTWLNGKDAEVSVELKEGEKTTVTYQNTYPGTHPVVISKRAISGNEELEGAILEITGQKADGTPITPIKWETEKNATTNNVEPFETALEPGEYTLTEITAPQGYQVAEEITFMVGVDGSIHKTSTTGELEGTTVIMRDAPLDVEVDKYKLTGTEELADAELALYDRADLNDNYELEDGKKALATWKSKEGEVWSIGDYLYAGQEKTYVLIETGAPQGYGYAKKIEFQVDADGQISNVQNVADGDLRATQNGTQGNMIIMRDTPIDISLHKVDNQNNPVGSAGISVYQVEDMDGNVPKAEAKPVYSGTTPENGILSFGSELTANADGTPKEYVIVETNTPDGYQTAEPVHIWVQSDGTVVNRADTKTTSIDMIDVLEDAKVGSLVITKTISGELTPEKVSGDIKFHVKGMEGAAATSEYKDGKTISFGEFDPSGDNEYTLTLYPMELGTYEVWETVEDPDGVKHTTKYTVTTNNEISETEEEMDPDKHVEIALGQKDDVVTVAYENNYQYIKGKILLRKSFASSADTLKWDDIKGKLTFFVYEGDVVEGKEPVATVNGSDDTGWTKVAGEENQWEYELELKIGTYTVVEVCDAISDYVSMTTYTVGAVAGTGTNATNISVTEDAETTVAYNNVYVRPVYISKKAIAGTEEIDRPASLTVSGTEDDGTPFSDSWFTGKEPHKLQLKPGEYTLTENTAPQGYAKAEDIKFTISDKGDIIITSDQVDSLDVDGRTITMWDAPLHLKMNKMALVTDDSGTALSDENKVGEPLEGAEIEIYEVKADTSRELMTSWSSTGTNTPHDFGPDLYAGRSYVLVERQAPQGYLIAKEIAFTIADDGTVNVDSVQDNNYYQGSDGVIYMLDKESDEHLVSLLLTKSIKGIDYKDAGGLLSFKVKCVSGEGVGYEDTFTIGDQGYNGFTWDGEKYIHLVTNLVPGSYTVTENWTDSDSIVCQERSYTIKITREGEEYVTSNPVKDSNNTTGQFSTPEFSLMGDNTAEVNFENTYVTKGTLIITKTVAGDVTKEEAENTVTFTVTENSTTKEYTYTLKDDFVYNSVTKQWTKELSLTAGGYTVEESANTSDGKTCTTTYTVTGGTSQNGVDTQVANVVLEAGGTTTVAYTNTYTANTANTLKPGSDDNSDDNIDGGSDVNIDDGSDDSSDVSSGGNSGASSDDKSGTSSGGNSGASSNDNSGASSDDKSGVSSEGSSGASSDVKNGESSVLTETVLNVAAGLVKTGDGVSVGAWLLLLLFGVAEAIDAGYALSHRKKKD